MPLIMKKVRGVAGREEKVRKTLEGTEGEGRKESMFISIHVYAW